MQEGAQGAGWDGVARGAEQRRALHLTEKQRGEEQHPGEQRGQGARQEDAPAAPEGAHERGGVPFRTRDAIHGDAPEDQADATETHRLSEGQQLVTAGVRRLTDGQRVKLLGNG